MDEAKVGTGEYRPDKDEGGHGHSEPAVDEHSTESDGSQGPLDSLSVLGGGLGSSAAQLSVTGTTTGQIEFPSPDLFPSVIGRLERVSTIDDITSESVSGEMIRLAKGEDKHTPEDEQLLEDWESLEKYLRGMPGHKLTWSNSDLYTPAELHELVQRLERFRQGHHSEGRPNFGGIEEDVIAVLKNRMSRNFISNDKTISGVIDRAEKEAKTRSGMQYATLNTLATHAVGLINNGPERRTYGRGTKDRRQEEVSRYAVDVVDPDEEGLDGVYQFIATVYAGEIVGSRIESSNEAHLSILRNNYEILKQYYSEIQQSLHSIPDVLRGASGGVNAHRPASSVIGMLFKNLDIRMDEDYESRTGRLRAPAQKLYINDVDGAIRHTIRIGLAIEELRKALTKAREGQVVPLDLAAIDKMLLDGGDGETDDPASVLV